MWEWVSLEWGFEELVAAKAVGECDFGCVFKRRGGRGAETFRWCGAAGEIFLTSIMLQRKQKPNVLFTSGKPRQAGPSKTSERARPHRSGGDKPLAGC